MPPPEAGLLAAGGVEVRILLVLIAPEAVIGIGGGAWRQCFFPGRKNRHFTMVHMVHARLAEKHRDLQMDLVSAQISTPDGQ